MINSDSFYRDVGAQDELTSDWVVPDGEMWEIINFCGSAAYLDDTVVSLVFDPTGANEIIVCTHGDANLSPNRKVTGNGTKVLRIVLTNDTSVPRILGASWTAKKVSNG
jgi:hypothetical protein